MAIQANPEPVTHTIKSEDIKDPLMEIPQVGVLRSTHPTSYSSADEYVGDVPSSPDFEETESISQPQDISLEMMQQMLQDRLQPQQQAEVPKEPSTPVGFEQFSQDFEKYLGVPLQEAVETVKQLQAYQYQQEYQNKVQKIASVWGVSNEEATQRMALVDSRYRQLSPEAQQVLLLDPLKGAQLLYQQIEQEQQVNVPRLDRSQVQQTVATKPKGSFSRAELAAMSDAEYRARQKEIIYAYNNGLVY